MTCECCAELTARVEVLEREKAELANRVHGDHHQRLSIHGDRIDGLDEQVDGLIDTTDDHGTKIISLEANQQRLNSIALRQMRAIRTIDGNVKTVLERLPVKPVTP